MTTKVRASTLDLPSIPGSVGVVGGPRSTVPAFTTINLLTLGATTQNIAISGTASITGFQIANGQTFICSFLGSSQLVNSSSLITQTGTNIIGAAGDTFLLRAIADNIVEILCYARNTESIRVVPAQCRLSKVGANIALIRFGGSSLFINGVNETIPAAGVSLAPTGLTPATLYYVYAYMNAGVMTLEASTTGHSTDTVSGVEIKSGDVTRTLVGMVRPITGPAFQDTLSQRFVVSYYNRKPIAVVSGFSASRATSNTSPSEINIEIRGEYLYWLGDTINLAVDGPISLSVLNGTVTTQLLIDSALTLDGMGFAQAYANNVGVSANCSALTTIGSEGYHFSTLWAYVSSGTTASFGGGAVGSISRVSLKTIIQA